MAPREHLKATAGALLTKSTNHSRYVAHPGGAPALTGSGGTCAPPPSQLRPAAKGEQKEHNDTHIRNKT